MIFAEAHDFCPSPSPLSLGLAIKRKIRAFEMGDFFFFFFFEGFVEEFSKGVCKGGVFRGGAGEFDKSYS